MIKKLYIILCVCMKISLVAAQTIIQGSVLNEQGKATEAFVMVSPKGTSCILAFADTDTKGQYRLEFKTEADSVIVSVSGLGIGNQAKVFANRSQILNITVKEEATELKEVSVKAEKIR